MNCANERVGIAWDLGRRFNQESEDRLMAACDCCSKDKPDVKIRVGLRGAPSRGNVTATPFHGPLCNDCLARTSEFGSTEQRWLLHQIMTRMNITQALSAKPPHGT